VDKNYQSQTVKSCSDADYYKASGSKTALKIFLSNCGDMGHYNYKKAYSLLKPKLVFRPKPEPKPDPPKPEPEPEPEPPPVKPQSQTVKSCSDADYYKASGSKTALKIFLSNCGDMGHYNYKKAYSLLKPKLVFRPKPELKVVLPKVTASPQKVAKQAEKPQAIIIPTGSLGEISEVRKIILEKTFESKLDDYFAIVPKDMFEEAKEEAFQELEDEECTEDQCVMKIQEILQVENAFKMQLIMDGQDTQISITWNNQEEKRVEEDYCEGCKTKELRNIVSGLVEKLVGGNN
jgi:transposase